jgi:ABC-type branched-subunit amino acid transport system ATPase component
MIGPNGAGKTTVFNCLTGFYKPSGGTILLDGQPIQGLAGHRSPARAWCAPSRTCACSRK